MNRTHYAGKVSGNVEMAKNRSVPNIMSVGSRFVK